MDCDPQPSCAEAQADPSAPKAGARTVVVMGVSGCGKSTLAAALARSLGWTFIEGDRLHPQANVDKMSAGVALTDEDRAPFIDNVAAALAAAPEGAVAACSALKRGYRDRIRALCGGVFFVLPTAPRAVLMRRLSHRGGHFMPVSLLDSQLATLETPAWDEAAMTLNGLAPLADQVSAVRAALDEPAYAPTAEPSFRRC